MAVSDLFAWSGSKFKHDDESRVERRAKRKAEQEANWRAVCKQVDRRDHYRCRACGSQCDPDAVDLLEKAHRHHLAYRSKGGQDVASNLLTLCARCHDHEHRHLLRIDVGVHGADGPIEVWRFNRTEEMWYLARREQGIHRIERD
jgi:5-methylcytosine-specific restriction endonuclease McrA